jgi:hypothetical protein
MHASSVSAYHEAKMPPLMNFMLIWQRFVGENRDIHGEEGKRKQSIILLLGYFFNLPRREQGYYRFVLAARKKIVDKTSKKEREFTGLVSLDGPNEFWFCFGKKKVDRGRKVILFFVSYSQGHARNNRKKNRYGTDI